MVVPQKVVTNPSVIGLDV